MSCPVNLQALQAAAFHQVPSPRNVGARPAGRSPTVLSFPKSRTCLWDERPTGEKLCIQLCSHRMPRLLLREKALRLAQRHARRCHASPVRCFFLGSVVVDADEEGVTVTLDRFDPGRERAADPDRVPAAAVPGDALVPCTFSGRESSEDVIQSEAELTRSISALRAHVSGRQPLDLCRLMEVKGRVGCERRGDAASFWLGWSCVCPSVRLDARPVRPVPVIPTALLRSLSGATGRRRGFVTMDQSRKLLLLLESDPKASKLPLVGIWLSGVSHVSNPHVCAWCLRFLFGSALQDRLVTSQQAQAPKAAPPRFCRALVRVLSEDGAFLLVTFAPPRAAPAFFRCRPCASASAPARLECRLLSARRRVTLCQGAAAEGRPLEFQLIPEGHPRQICAFRDARRSLGSDSPPPPTAAAATCVSEQDSGVQEDEWSPRPSPRPHFPAQQAPPVQPAVPELSLLMDGGPPGAEDDGERDPPLLHSTPDPQRTPPAPEPLRPPASCETESHHVQRFLWQNQQLRLLQAQVQMLLEAQAVRPGRETKGARTSSSVAVATGASLLWGAQTPPPLALPRALASPPREDDVAGRGPPVETEPRFYGEHAHGAAEVTSDTPASQKKGRGGSAEDQEVVTAMSQQDSAPSDPDGTAVLLQYLKRWAPGDAGSPGPALSPLSPSNMSVATATYMRRHGLLAGPLQLPPESRSIGEAAAPDGDQEKPEAGRPPAPADADASVGNILDLSRLRRLPKLF
ncbi:SCL-interrupting locus protein homolog isoform X3 [Hippocampus zosterae]|uniref:SCL-interrupting locus protein homolog isoform X3 n=1 Tax=Hippocampus zosterae TaxID=109293 RepID=UPI00223CC717|nr:SCL-interrupting locus protein homolog isoform X3 [Hippocampus zosterae]